ncbi:MAG: hypothetical protein RJA36_1162 [Pseudomonadota bacterium]
MSRHDDKPSEPEKPLKIHWAILEDMKPTQASVGFLEVELKMRELEEKARDGILARYLEKHPIPAVRGPDGRMYLTDHHHMGLAMQRLADAWDQSEQPAGANPYRKCCFVLEEDYGSESSMSMHGFWRAMEAEGLCHFYDGNGKRTQALPKTLENLQDDPYRSLAGLARKAGAYEKVDIPYTEFKWADFLRTRIPATEITMSHLDQAIEHATRLARSPEAEGLPGYLKTPPAPPAPDLTAIGARLQSRHGAADEPEASIAHKPHHHHKA